MRRFVCILSLILCFCASSQVSDTTKVLSITDETAEYPGGYSEMLSFFSKNIEYPKCDINTDGTRIFVEFVVNVDGTLTDFRLIKGDNKELYEELIRVLKLSPNWIPAMHKGEKVKSKFILPFTICLG